MESHNGNNYVINKDDGLTEEEKYFCFNTAGLSKDDIISKLDELIFKYQSRIEFNEE